MSEIMDYYILYDFSGPFGYCFKVSKVAVSLILMGGHANLFFLGRYHTTSNGCVAIIMPL